MKGNVVRGSGFRGGLNYLLTSFDENNERVLRPGAELIGGNMSGQNPRTLANEFAVTRRLRPECMRPVWHTSLSLPANENLTDEQWQEAAEKLMQKVGLDTNNYMYTVVKHDDTKHEHAHIIASRIGLNSEIWHGKWEARAVQIATQEIEKEMGLTLTPGPDTPKDDYMQRPQPDKPKVKVSKKERKLWKNRDFEFTPKEFIAHNIEKCLEQGIYDIYDLQDALYENANIKLNINTYKDGRIYGLSYEVLTSYEEDEHCYYKASQLHKNYGWNNFSKRLDYLKAEAETEAESEEYNDQDFIKDIEDYLIERESISPSNAVFNDIETLLSDKLQELQFKIEDSEKLTETDYQIIDELKRILDEEDLDKAEDIYKEMRLR